MFQLRQLLIQTLHTSPTTNWIDQVQNFTCHLSIHFFNLTVLVSQSCVRLIQKVSLIDDLNKFLLKRSKSFFCLSNLNIFLSYYLLLQMYSPGKLFRHNLFGKFKLFLHLIVLTSVHNISSTDLLLKLSYQLIFFTYYTLQLAKVRWLNV